ncbi:hypothetical protein FRC03_005546 [Tulasnella sp. 419]|nr:hypothetical protein FRC03_005546 [Tulasnella sp. 419]
MDLMLSHYHYLIEQRFECVDHKTLGTYFQNAFLKEQNRLGLGPKGSKPDEGEEQRPSHGFQSSRNRGRRLLVLEDPPENLTTKAPIPTPEQLKRYNKIREILESLGLPIS